MSGAAGLKIETRPSRFGARPPLSDDDVEPTPTVEHSSSVDSDSFPPPMQLGGRPPAHFSRGAAATDSEEEEDDSSGSEISPAPQVLNKKRNSGQSSGRRRRQRSKFFDYEGDNQVLNASADRSDSTASNGSWSSGEENDEFDGDMMMMNGRPGRSGINQPNSVDGRPKGPGYWILTPHGKQWHVGRPCTDHLMLLTSEGDRKRFGREKATERYEKLLLDEVAANVTVSGNGGDDDPEQGVDSIMDEGLVHHIGLISGHESLVTLGIQFSGLTKKSASALAEKCISVNLPATLTSISLAKNPGVGDMGAMDLINALATNTTVTHLDLSECRIAKQAASALAAVLSGKNNTLTSIDLSCNELKGKGIADIFEALAQNTTIKVLQLHECGSYHTCLNDHLTESIVRGLEGTKSLEVLDVSGVRMPADVFTALCQGLQANRTINTLELSNMALNGQECTELCTALLKHPCLARLSLHDNQINGGGVDSVWCLVKRCPTLHSLNVARNRFLSRRLSHTNVCDIEDAPGFTSFTDEEWIKQVLASPNIRSLNLRGVGLTNDHAMHIAEALKDNGHLECLDLGEHWIEEDGMRCIADALETNTELTSMYFLRDKMHYKDFPEIELEMTPERRAEIECQENFHQRLLEQAGRMRACVERNQALHRDKRSSVVYMDDLDWDWDFEDGFETSIF